MQEAIMGPCNENTFKKFYQWFNQMLRTVTNLPWKIIALNPKGEYIYKCVDALIKTYTEPKHM